MPSYAIKSSGIRQVAANSLIGNSTGSTGAAEELSATDAKTLLGLGTTDSPTFDDITATGSAYVGYGTKIASSNSGRIDFSAGGVALFGLSNGGATLPTNGYFAFGSNYLNPSRARIYSDADNQIDIRYSTNAQTLNIYNTDDGSQTNYERGIFDWSTTSNVLTIGTEAAGTGTQRSVKVTGGGYTVIQGASGSELHQGGSRVLRCSGAAYFYKSAEPIGTINLGGSSSRWANVYGTNADLSEALTLTSHTPSTTTNKLYNVSGTLYFNGSAAGGNPFNQNLNTSDSPTFASATIGNITLSDAGSYDSITSGDARLALRAQDGSMELYLENASDGNDSFRFNTNNGIFELFSDADNQIDLRNGTSPNTLNVYNTYTDASNNEYATFDWSTTANTLTIGTVANGTGVLRAVEFVGSAFDFDNKTITAGELQLGNTGQCKLDFAGTSLYATGPEGIIFRFESDTTNASIFRFYGNSGDQLTASSGVQSFLDIDADINQSSTAGYTGIDLDVTETATGSGDKNLIDLKVGGTSKFKVDNAGGVSMPNLPTSDPASAGELWNDSGTLKVSAG